MIDKLSSSQAKQIAKAHALRSNLRKRKQQKVSRDTFFAEDIKKKIPVKDLQEKDIK